MDNPFINIKKELGFNDRYVAIEGIDGSGKSTVLESYSVNLGNNIKIFHDPCNETKLGKFVNHYEAKSKFVTTLLYGASSIEYQELNFKPNQFVISDRSAISTFAYSPDVDYEYMINIHTGYVYPRYIVYFDVSEITAASRIKQRENTTIPVEKLVKLKQGYQKALSFYQECGGKVHRIDANLDKDELLNSFISQIEEIKNNGYNIDY